MLGPNHNSVSLANQTYGERLDHAARIRMVQRDRQEGSRAFNVEAHRILTVRRLATTMAAAALTAAIAAGTVGAVAASPNAAQGGGVTLIR